MHVLGLNALLFGQLLDFVDPWVVSLSTGFFLGDVEVEFLELSAVGPEGGVDGVDAVEVVWLALLFGSTS